MKKYALELRPLAAAGAVVQGRDYRFTVLTDCLIRMEYQADGHFVDEATKTVVCREFPVPAFRVMEKKDSLEIVTEKLHLYYDKKPFSPEGLRIELSGGFHVYGSSWAYGDVIRDLKGTASTLDGADGAIELEPGLLSRDGFTVLDDSESCFIMEDQWAVAKGWESTDLYFLGYGHDYLGCLRDFYRLSGATPLLPRFTLGNWWSRFYRYSEDSYIALMDKFREKGIPFSTAVIDMDWHLVDIPRKYGSGWTGYTWNPELFPDPKRFMDRLHDYGMKVTLNVHPADGVRGHEEFYVPMAKAMGVDYEKEDKVPFDASSRRFFDAYFKYLHHPNEERGVDFWWLDWQQGSRGGAKGIDTLWLLNHLHFLDRGREGKQPLTFSRYAGLGSHRYPIGFSGDTYSTWESLNFQPYFTANASNAGYSWWSHDIGGHQGGRRDDELAVRWVQLGVFSPIMRLHSTCNEFYGKEPWNYGLEAEKTMTEFLQLRHKLIPYLYTMNYLTHTQGLPLVRPMYYHHEDWAAYEVPNEYYFGTEMIVCPITAPADKQTLLAGFEAWLPEGEWVDFFTGQVYRGGQRTALYRNLDSIPVLVKAGGIVPMAKDGMRSHLENPGELEVQVFNGADGRFELYEDGGGESAVTRFVFAPGERAVLTAQVTGDAGVIPEDRVCHLALRAMRKPEAVLLNGEETAWEYDGERRAVLVSVPCGRAGFRVELEGTAAAVLAPDAEKAVYRILHRAQIPYAMKTEVFEAVCAEKELSRKVRKLMGAKLPESLLGAMLEWVL